MPVMLPRAERISNAHLVWGGGNQFSAVSPFFAIPSWWRSFFFTVLSPRDIAIYTYICSHMDENAIAYPTYQYMKADLNISNARIIKKSLDHLIDCGFLMVRILAPIRISRHSRNVYQRPCIEYTLRELLNKNYIDTAFRPQIPKPAAAAVRGDRIGRNEASIRGGLYRLLGGAGLRAWEVAAPEDQLNVLTTLLQRRIDERRLAYDQSVQPDAAAQAEAEKFLSEGGDGITWEEQIDKTFRPRSDNLVAADELFDL
jgi:hypothetical protein